MSDVRFRGLLRMYRNQTKICQGFKLRNSICHFECWNPNDNGHRKKTHLPDHSFGPSGEHLSQKENSTISYSENSIVYVVTTRPPGNVSIQSWLSATHSRFQFAEIPARAPKASKSHPAMSIGRCSSLPQNTFGYLRLPSKTSRGKWHLPSFCGHANYLSMADCLSGCCTTEIMVCNVPDVSVKTIS